ncbi:MAG TPA: hypothetical protein VME46_25200 [Acidimicrobiales bacterium]|nr:hypothetical protein [Acidimicrobiales bacterium]
MSTKVWYCANCGYEVTSRGRCHSCGERLIASPLPELESGPDDDEVGYRLDQWDDLTRSQLIRSLITAGIEHRFEEEELVVLAEDEPAVDGIVARLAGGGGDEDADDEDGDEDAVGAPVRGDANAARELYDAARRLRDDPTDMQADAALGEASAAVFAVDYLPDLDEADMAAVGRVTRRLLGALGSDEALENEIRHQAEVLCRLVAPSAGEDVARAEAEKARQRLEAGARETGRLVELPQSEVTPAGEMPSTLLAHVAGEAGAGEARAGEVGTGGDGLTADSDLGVTGSSGAATGQTTAAELAAAQAAAAELAAAQAAGTEAGGGGPSALARAGDLAAQAPLATAGGPVAGAGAGQGAGLAGLGAEADEPEDEQDEYDEQEEDEDEDEEAGTGELVYELGEWLPEQRVELSMLLETAGIAYNWDGTDLTVAETYEIEVDGLFEQVHGLVDEDDEARYHAIEELFGSVDRLANDPANEERQKAFLETVGAVEQPTPVGVDDAYWWRVRSQGHALVAALEHEARLEEISREAALLAEMLHEMV